MVVVVGGWTITYRFAVLGLVFFRGPWAILLSVPGSGTGLVVEVEGYVYCQQHGWYKNFKEGCWDWDETDAMVLWCMGWRKLLIGLSIT